MDETTNDLPGGPDDEALTDDDALVDTEAPTDAEAVVAERPGEATDQPGTGEMVLTDEERADELGQGAPSMGVAAGGETVAGSGHVETMGGVLSGGQDYTAVNLGGTGVDRGDPGREEAVSRDEAVSRVEDDDEPL